MAIYFNKTPIPLLFYFFSIYHDLFVCNVIENINLINTFFLSHNLPRFILCQMNRQLDVFHSLNRQYNLSAVARAVINLL